jgi:hypothetical protein
MTIDPSLLQIGTRNSSLHKFATSRSFVPPSGAIFLTLEEVVERYRGQVSEGTLRNWRSMRIRSIVHQDRQSHSLSAGGARSLGSQKSSCLPTLTIAPVGGSCGVTSASLAVTAE